MVINDDFDRKLKLQVASLLKQRFQNRQEIELESTRRNLLLYVETNFLCDVDMICQQMTFRDLHKFSKLRSRHRATRRETPSYHCVTLPHSSRHLLSTEALNAFAKFQENVIYVLRRKRI